MPLIPGSALKGLASHYAASMPVDEVSEEQRDALFGTVENAGYLTWLDAWHVPDPARSPFALDVVTPHHGQYYHDPASNPPWDFDDPIPSNFLSVRGTFLVAIQAPDEAWAQAAMNVLTRALDEWGIGAKTNAGYGRMTFVEHESAWIRDAEERVKVEEEAVRVREAQEAAADEAIRKIGVLVEELADPTRTIDQQATRWVAIWDTITDDDERTRVGTLILQRLQAKPSEYHRVSGRVMTGYKKAPGSVKGYFKPLLDWMDEHVPEVSRP